MTPASTLTSTASTVPSVQPAVVSGHHLPLGRHLSWWPHRAGLGGPSLLLRGTTGKHPGRPSTCQLLLPPGLKHPLPNPRASGKQCPLQVRTGGRRCHLLSWHLRFSPVPQGVRGPGSEATGGGGDVSEVHTTQAPGRGWLHWAQGSGTYPGCDQGPEPTCADKHDVVHSPVQGLGPVHHDLGVVHTAFDQPGPVACRGHRVVHQRVVFDELQRLVGQAERAGQVGGPRLAVDALRGADGRVTRDSRSRAAQARPGAQNQGLRSGFLEKGDPRRPSLNLRTVMAWGSAAVYPQDTIQLCFVTQRGSFYLFINEKED